MQTFVEFVVKGLVSQPEEVRVEPAERKGMTVYEISVAPGDAGKVIGRRGTTIQTLRSLVQMGSAKQGRRCTVDLVE
jgi:predicted RNA-binding protein YlqC (UPF0109 family)